MPLIPVYQPILIDSSTPKIDETANQWYSFYEKGVEIRSNRAICRRCVVCNGFRLGDGLTELSGSCDWGKTDVGAGMGKKDILSILNALSEGIVLADPSDLQAFATLHTHLQDAGEWAETELLKSAPHHIKSASDLIEGIILNEVPDVKAAIQTVARIVEALQGIARDGRSESEVAFPVEPDRTEGEAEIDAGTTAGGPPSTRTTSVSHESGKSRTLRGRSSNACHRATWSDVCRMKGRFA